MVLDCPSIAVFHQSLIKIDEISRQTFPPDTQQNLLKFPANPYKPRIFENPTILNDVIQILNLNPLITLL